MTEVRPTPNSGFALYATKSYQPGDIIIEESPLVVFAPRSSEQILKVRSEFRGLPSLPTNTHENENDDEDGHHNSKKANKKSSKHAAKMQQKNLKKKQAITASQSCCLFDISLPSTIDSSQSNKFRGMLIAAACYALFSKNNNEDKHKSTGEKETTLSQRIQKLYSPSTDSTDTINDDEKKALEMAAHALTFLQNRTDPNGHLRALSTRHPSECQMAMLIWLCNSFKGGVVYETMSRINHSCDFNCVVSPSIDNEDNQVLRAACAIPTAEEISISYLGSLTYACHSTRVRRLQMDKYFTCHCSRCDGGDSGGGEDRGDVAASVPCRKCHPRLGRYLEEEAQYDDDEDVTIEYAVPHWRQCTTEASVGDTKGSEAPKWVCNVCNEKTPVVVINSKDDGVSIAMKKTFERVELHITQDDRNPTDVNAKETMNEEDQGMLEKLSHLSSSVLGSMHWCTNMVLVSILSRKLTSIHASILCSTTADKGQDRESVMAELAECIDSLQRLWGFVEKLGLKAHPGHLLGSLTIGVARVLISLGDEKSIKYGVEWANRVDEDYYQRGFEGEAMIKVLYTMCNGKGKTGVREREEEETNVENKKKLKCS